MSRPTPELDRRAPVTVTVRRELGGDAGAWDELVLASRLPSPFLLSWWLGAVVTGRPHFVLVHEGRRLVGGLALEERWRLGARWWSAAGSGPLCPDHLDAVAGPDRDGPVTRALREWFEAQPGRVVDLHGVPAGSLVARALPGSVRVGEIAVAPWAPLEGSLAGYLAARPSRLRHSVERAGRRLDAAGYRPRQVEPGDGVAALERLRVLHHAPQWGDRSGLLRRWDAFAHAAAAGSERGHVAIYELAHDDHVVAASVWLEAAGRASYYNGGRDVDDRAWRGAGAVLMAAAIGAAHERGCREVDFLRGDEAYKSEWATDRRPLLRVQSTAGPVAAAGRWADAAAERSRRRLGRLARRAGVR